jgi:SAM-dependent methyltransferase
MVKLILATATPFDRRNLTPLPSTAESPSVRKNTVPNRLERERRAPVDHREVGRLWEGNAEAWTRLARAGYDVCRDKVNTPAFLAMLPDVTGLSGLDIGCGEGNNTRLVARRGARMAAIDVSPTFVRHANAAEDREPLGIRYGVASAVELPFADRTFDFAMATMSFMDIPDHERVVREAHRVLRLGGFLQFSICHPCFSTVRWEWLRDEKGKKCAVACGDYFFPPPPKIEEWTFGAAPPEAREGLPPFRTAYFHRTLSGWLNLLLETGFTLERFCEPCPGEETAAECPHVADMWLVAFYLVIRCRKSRGGGLG